MMGTSPFMLIIGLPRVVTNKIHLPFSLRYSAMSSTFKNLITGGFFGATLLLSGVSSPSVIISQLNLQNFHMLKVFVGASALSA